MPIWTYKVLKCAKDYWLAPGELLVEAQLTEFQQGARGVSLVTNNRPRWCANIETEYIGSRFSLNHSQAEVNTVPKTFWTTRNQAAPAAPGRMRRRWTAALRRLSGGGGARWTPRVRRPSATSGSGASSAQRWGNIVSSTRFGCPLKRRFVGPAVGPHGGVHAFGCSLPRERPSGAALGAAALRWRGRWHPRVRRTVDSAAVRRGAGLLGRKGGAHPPAHPPRAPCSSSTDAPPWPKPDLSTRQILTAAASSRSARLQAHPLLARLTLQFLAAPR